MFIKNFFPFVGQLHYWVYKLPFLGETLVRGANRAVAQAAYHLPVLGGKLCQTVSELKSEWFRFLERLGLAPRATYEDENSFHWEIDFCPYHFHRLEDQGVCDACMDLDREYIEQLGGRLEILETIPGGSHSCRFITHLYNVK